MATQATSGQGMRPCAAWLKSGGC
ncbi:uncharacterized protein METZ01_LOCUS218063 [marine metagenome]|uniref:Uncharacterized protein n=1 Tax=marine metagenome TaxID=408172 RepID=A0A382FRA5_9ZZZZ